jgi:apolipoprotein N-acyltransferase
MLNKLNWDSISYRTQQVVIFVAHLALLKWIFFTLYESGTLSSKEILMHFAGMAVLGAFLIRISAWVAQRKYLKDGNELIK